MRDECGALVTKRLRINVQDVRSRNAIESESNGRGGEVQCYHVKYTETIAIIWSCDHMTILSYDHTII